MSIALPPIETRYLFDRTGKSRDNYVTGETHEIPHAVNRIIVPRNGAYFTDSLVVRSNKKTLIKGVDYVPASLYSDASEATGLAVHVMIYFINDDVVGEVELSYQVVGGSYTGIFETIQEYVNALLIDPRSVTWDEILNKPEFYVPMDHWHDINDVYGLNELIPEIQEIAAAIRRLRSTELRNVYLKIMEARNYADTLLDQFATKFGKNIDKVLTLSDSIDTKIATESKARSDKDTELKANIDKLKASLETEVQEREQDIRDTDADIKALQQKDTELNKKLTDNVTSINTNVTNLSNSLTALTKKVNDGATALTALSQRVSTLETTASTLSAKLDKEIADRTKVTNALNTEIDKLKEKDISLTNSINTAVTNLTTVINNKEKALNTKITELSTKIDNLAGTGLSYSKGKLNVNTTPLKDSSNTVTIGYLVNKG